MVVGVHWNFLQLHPVSIYLPMASVWGAGGRGSQGRASRLSQLVKAATERQDQRATSTASRSIDTPLRARSGGPRSREADSVLGQGGEEEATFYSDEEDSEDDEDEL